MDIDIGLIVGIAILVVVIGQLVAIILLFSKNKQSLQADIAHKFAEYAQSLEKNEAALRDEFGKNREETNKSAKDTREELSSNLKSTSEQLSSTITNFTGLVDNKMKNMQEFMDSGLKSNREELSASLKAFEDKSSEKIEALTKDTAEGLEKTRDSVEKKLTDMLQGNEKKLDEMRETTDSGLRNSREIFSTSLNSFEEKSSLKIDTLTKNTKEGLEKTRDSVDKKLTDMLKENDRNINRMKETIDSGLKLNREEVSISLKAFEDKFAGKFETLTKGVEKNLADIQKGNEKKLDEMRQTVDEKLHKTLETRLGESFKLITDRLELVQKSLGEMQTLANEVGSVKNVLYNVKAKGILGEYQLAAIFEQTLSPEQYAQGVETKAGSGESVEFAVKIPNREDLSKVIWLPIDAKFPTSDYETLLDAYEKGEKEDVVKAQEELKAKIETFAENIHQKYIAPPNTTEFGIMFLPFEGLYAEVLRIPGLFESIQSTHKVTIAGPTTISAFLNSLQMGFRSLVIEKRTNEVWNLLGAVKTEFSKFGVVLQKTKEKLSIALSEIDNADSQTKAIEKKLSGVQTLPEVEAQKLLLSNDVGEESTAAVEAVKADVKVEAVAVASASVEAGADVSVAAADEVE